MTTENPVVSQQYQSLAGKAHEAIRARTAQGKIFIQVGSAT